MSSLRIAIRTLLKSPTFTLIALVTLALGIGVNTSMYTLIDVLLFRAAPFPEAENLLLVRGKNGRGQNEGVSFIESEEMRAQAATPLEATASGDADHAFEALTTMSGWNNTLAEPGQPAERLAAIDATADFFRTFRVQPMLGRAFTPEEQVPGRNQVAILSYDLWQSRFGGDPAIVGRAIRLNAEQVTVIGVMPASFQYPLFFGKVDLWRPITIPRHIVDDRDNRFFFVVGRLNHGVTPEQAKAQLTPLAERWARDYPHNSVGRGFDLMPMHQAVMDDTGRSIMWLLLGLAGAVLLIACANLANLQLARAAANAKDLAIRSALGASRPRLIAHQLIECMLLAVAGGVCGVLVALWVNALLSRGIRIGDAGGLALPINGWVLAVTLFISLLSGILFGLLPAWLASRSDVVSTLKQQSRGSTAGRGHRFVRHSLIVAEVALALALLGVAGVLIRGFDAMLEKPCGWDKDRIVAANIHLPEQSTYNTDEKRRIAIDKLERRLREIAGAEHTTVCSTVPIFGYSKTSPIQVDGVTSEDINTQPIAGWTMVGADYFATMGIPFKEGRNFPREIQAEHPQVIIVGETLARQFWPNETAIGKRIGQLEGDHVVWREIIGVVRDIEFALNIANPPTLLQIYKPNVNEPWGYLHLVARGVAPGRLKNDLRRAMADVDADVAVQQMYTIPEAAERFQHNLVVVNQTLGGFALLGLVLAAVGLYGVVSHLVAQRTGEFGIRLALGARPRDVLLMVLRAGMILTVLGLAVGSVLGFALNVMVRGWMPRMAALDFSALGGVAFALLIVAIFACWWPARRATQVDPLTALRAE